MSLFTYVNDFPFSFHSSCLIVPSVLRFTSCAIVYEEVAAKLTDKFGFEVVVITVRETPSVLQNKWSVFAYADGNVFKSPVYDVEVIDRLGGGDSCSAGFIYGYLELKDLQKAVDFGSAFSALKHSVPGDLAFVYKSEVEKLIKGRERGLRIDR